MFQKVIIGQIVVLMLQMFLTCIASSRRHGCMEGKCAMKACRSSPGAGRSNFCYIAADSAGNYLTCGRQEDCSSAARSWGNCKAFSCFSNRAPDPFSSGSKTCESMNRKKLDELKGECKSFSFEKWIRDYSTPREIVKKFEPCVGDVIEGETKKVIKFCHCYNSCGQTQADNNDCEVLGLDRRLDMEANTETTYQTVCKIDCNPVDKYKFVTALKHTGPNKANLKASITQGISQSKTSSRGGSSSATVSGEVSANVLEVFSVKIGVSASTGFDWSSSSTAGSYEQRTYEVSVPVDSGDEISIYQVIGECENTDGTKYTLQTRKYETRKEDGTVVTTADLPAEH